MRVACGISSISSMSTVCVDRSAPDVCLNMSASFSTATAAMRVNKDFPTHLEPTRWARRSSTTY